MLIHHESRFMNPDALVRRSEIEGMMAIVVRGDALIPSDVEAAFAQIEEIDAVVSTIGGSPADPRADAEVCPSFSLERLN